MYRIPSEIDCVRARVRTSGIVEEKFDHGNIVIRLFDAGGQRAERRKWIHCFDNVTAVIFVAAISEVSSTFIFTTSTLALFLLAYLSIFVSTCTDFMYTLTNQSQYDQVLFEDSSKNRLEESVELFADTCNSKWFTKAPMLLFLNKRDLMERKFLVDKVPLNVSGCFPDAPKGNEDLGEALEWMTKLFLDVRRDKDKPIFVHVTTATDPRNVMTVFNDCTSIILSSSLAVSGLAV